MRRWQLFILSFLVLIFISCNIESTNAFAKEIDPVAQKLELIKEKRAHIKELLKENEKLEKQIDKKSRQVDKILVEFSKSSIVPKETVEAQLSGRLEMIMTQLMQIGEVESDSWKNLKTANNHIEAKEYDIGIGYLDNAIENLEEKSGMMMVFSDNLDEFIVFLNSMQYK
ncbi:hypothetical protein JK636_16285 [Clostridium sp. YIM B02515]|uniref:Uncharacterized protein n=1 Tax=Clostridium rhizosphaerae TaxID=2803861 RepID=A0ABS1TD60_9CLOT|nr:hypothetical protein [Clostridium rhizosphaerae]MBL4937288.1 hypothetical protein [Clostridium rhizosphaerae]